jgi:hypothetical protein
MSFPELNFGSLTLGNDDKDHPMTKPPLQPTNQMNTNYVDVGPFTISKLHIPDGFYTNPTTWSKSSTCSGHTEHEEDSFFRPDRESRDNRFDHFGINHEGLRSPHLANTNQHSFVDNEDHFRFNSRYPAFENDHARPSNHQQEKLLFQMQMQMQMQQKKYLPEPPAPSPKPFIHSFQSGVANLPTTGGQGLRTSYSSVEHPEFSFSERSSPRLHQYSPTAAMALQQQQQQQQQSGWRQNSPTAHSVHSNQGSSRSTPVGTPRSQYSMPPSSPAAAYHSPYAQSAQGGVNGLIYQVQFKCAARNYILGSQAHPSIMIGDFVVVEADRGEDIGVVVEIIPMKTFVERRIYMKQTVDDENVIGRILRLASVAERQFLPEKFHDEDNIVQVSLFS